MKLLEALQCKNEGRPPVWLMRQAGRCLPVYRKLREKHSLEEIFHHPELAAQVTAMPVDQLGVDAAILFTDILTIAEVFGFEVRFLEGKGPLITPALTQPQDVERLVAKDVATTVAYVFETIKIIKKDLKVPLIGFCGGPFTVASYLIEGTPGGKELSKTKSWLFSHPDSFHLLLKKITEASIEYLKLQVEAGAQVLQIFDSWANVLSTPFFLTFCHHYLKQIVHALKPTGVPIILFCRGSSFFPQELASIEPAGISFDWHRELNILRRKVPPHIAVQGNFDPHLLKAPPAMIRSEVQRLLHSMHDDPGFIVNLGHGVLPDTPFEHVKCFVEAVKDHI
ncbi:MAG: uroporphyrinogen decarboxylase [Chlamydiales bacterium]|nr:uroporphyrinogen decarboxylase [Chlamydiales bacterium]